jgi:hypothetical protein
MGCGTDGHHHPQKLQHSDGDFGCRKHTHLRSLTNRDFAEQFDGGASVGPVSGYGVSCLWRWSFIESLACVRPASPLAVMPTVQFAQTSLIIASQPLASFAQRLPRQLKTDKQTHAEMIRSSCRWLACSCSFLSRPSAHCEAAASRRRLEGERYAYARGPHATAAEKMAAAGRLCSSQGLLTHCLFCYPAAPTTASTTTGGSTNTTSITLLLLRLLRRQRRRLPVAPLNGRELAASCSIVAGFEFERRTSWQRRRRCHVDLFFSPSAVAEQPASQPTGLIRLVEESRRSPVRSCGQ